MRVRGSKHGQVSSYVVRGSWRLQVVHGWKPQSGVSNRGVIRG